MAIGDFQRVAVVGAGLIGGSIALGLEAQGRPVVVFDRGDDLGAVRDADLVILAAPVLDNIRLLDTLGDRLSTDAIVTDTGSTKAVMAAAAAGRRFVGGHPIAGAAASGRGAARADLFVGRPWLLTPATDTAPDDIARVRAFVEHLGATVHVMSPDEHDRLFALISHLPQLVVSALMDVVGARAGVTGLALAGPGLRDTTRLAGSPPGVWRDVVRTNHANIAGSIDALIAVLTRLRDDDTGEALQAIFESAAAWQARLGGNGTGEPSS